MTVYGCQRCEGVWSTAEGRANHKCRPKAEKPAPVVDSEPEPEPIDTGARLVCPGCRSEIEIGADGQPVEHDIAHYSLERDRGDELEDTPAPVESPAPAPEPRRGPRFETIMFGGDE